MVLTGAILPENFGLTKTMYITHFIEVNRQLLIVNNWLLT